MEKEAGSLILSAHRVFLLSQRTEENPVYSVWRGIGTGRVAPLFCEVLRNLNSLIVLVSLVNLEWKGFMGEAIETCHTDAIHVHDAPMLGMTLSAVRRKGVPVIADLHENLPARWGSRGE